MSTILGTEQQKSTDPQNVTFGADGPPPGSVIAHSAPASGRFIGSPSIVQLPDGAYIASHDFFNHHERLDLTHVYRSENKGQSWRRIAALKEQWWSTLFVHDSALYLMGTTYEHGACVIRQSTDGGFTWTNPTDSSCGLLRGVGEYHTAPVPMLIHRGRIWRAIEDATNGKNWGERYSAMMLSAPLDADLLRADSWTNTPFVIGDKSWLTGTFFAWLEGNAVAAPNGEVLNILRVHQPDADEKAAVVHISADGQSISFDPTKDFIRFPGASKKFTIRFDPVSGRYWSLVNEILPEFRNAAEPAGVRNTQSLVSSADLREWTSHQVVLHHPDVRVHGFQYVDWQFDGNDLIAACRTAWPDASGDAASFHDANFLTFHRIVDFRRHVR